MESLAGIATRKYMTNPRDWFSITDVFSSLPFANSAINTSSESSTTDSDYVDAEMPIYENWAETPEVRYMKRSHMFAPLDDVLAFIEEHQFSPYYVHAVRINIVTAARAMRVPAPFGEAQRFPENCEYVDLDHPKICGPLTQLLNACELPDRQMNTGPSSQNGSLNDAKRSFDTAFAMLHSILKDVRPDRMARNGIYSRESFETNFGLVWRV